MKYSFKYKNTTLQPERFLLTVLTDEVFVLRLKGAYFKNDIQIEVRCSIIHQERHHFDKCIFDASQAVIEVCYIILFRTELRMWVPHFFSHEN